MLFYGNNYHTVNSKDMRVAVERQWSSQVMNKLYNLTFLFVLYRNSLLYHHSVRNFISPTGIKLMTKDTENLSFHARVAQG